MGRRGSGRRSIEPGRWIVPVLAAILVVVAALFVYGLRTVQSHRAVVETTLSDFAAFGAERIARELDRRFTLALLDQTAVARGAHYRWFASGTASSERPEGGNPVPDGTVPLFFSLDDTLLVAHGPAPDARTRRRIVDGIRGHLPIYPSPAPYAVLRSGSEPAIVYRREEAYGRVAVYGFLLSLEAPVEWYAGAVRRTSLLPRSLDDAASSRELFEVSIHLDPDAPALYTRPIGRPVDGPEAWAFAAKAGRLAVRARIDAEHAGPLVAGGPVGGSLPILLALGLITLGLIYLAILLSRRSARVAAMRESFIANVSHDLRTPITQIRMFSETLAMDRLDRPSERKRALRVIGRQAEILENLVANLLHASGSRPPIEPVPTDVAAIARDVVDALAPLAEERGCTIDVAMPDSLEATVDRMATTRILMNVVDNAIRHGVRGGRVVVTTEREPTLTLRVEDSGPGMPSDDRERIVERLGRARPGVPDVPDAPGPRPERPDSAGLGLGLSVVQSLAARHGGDVRFEEGEEGGTVVVVRLGTPDRAAGRMSGRAAAGLGPGEGEP